MDIKTCFKVHDVVNPDIYFCDISDTLDVASSIMTKHNIGSLLVKSRNRFEGIITERILIENVVSKNIKPSDRIVKDVMIDTIEISPFESILDACIIMAKNSIKILVVVENNKLIGVVSMSDIMSIFPDYIELLFEEARIDTLKFDNKNLLSKGFCELCGLYCDIIFHEDEYLCKDCLNDNYDL